MTGDHHAAAPADRRGTGRRGTGRQGSGWGPAIVILFVIVTLVVAPVALAAAAPSRADGTVGVYQRVTLRSEVDGVARIGGFIAPAGWQRSVEDDTVASYRRSGLVDSSRVTVSLHLDVADAEALLRQGIPGAAMLAPVQVVDSGNGLTTTMVEFDLEAGDRVTQRILACSVFDAQHCLLFEAVVSGTADAETVRGMVDSAEVL